MISRRRLLVTGTPSIALLRFAPVTLGLQLIARPASADVTTAVTIVQGAVTLYEMLNRKSGPGIIDLLQLQASLLKKISDQIAIVQRTLEEIFKEIDEIKKSVDNLPQAVVTELRKTDVTAAARHYAELMRTYEADRRKVGIAAAQDGIAAELEDEVLKPTRQARAVLMNYKNEATIPVIATAFQLEAHAMLMAGYRKNRIRAAFEEYQTWFGDWIKEDQLPKVCASLNEELAKTGSALADLRSSYDGYYCSNLHGIGTAAGMPVPGFEGTDFGMSVDETTDSARSELLRSYDDLLRVGANIDPAFQQIINFRFVKQVDSYRAFGDNLNAREQKLIRKRSKYPKNAGKCSADIIDRVMEERNARFGEVELLRVKALSYYSFLVASSAAHDAANGFLTDLDKPDVAALIR